MELCMWRELPSVGSFSSKNGRVANHEVFSVVSLFKYVVHKSCALTLRADVCKYRPRLGIIKILKNPKKILYTFLGILLMKASILVLSDKYFGDTAGVKFGRFTASARPLFQGPRPDYEKSSIWI